jgi:transcriptional regulator GlxA family with amidase domain
VLKNVAVAVGMNAAPFEIGVLSEVFGFDRSDEGLPVYDFALVAVDPPPLSTSAGFTINTEHGLERLAKADLVAIPGWDSPLPPNEAFLQALRDAVGRGARVMSACTGAFVLAASGLLDGKRATTHWRHSAELARRYPAIDVDCNVLYVDEGSVLTSAGTAAAIDLSLHIVRQEQGAHVANAIARRMVVPPHRDGGQAQYIETPVPQSAEADDLAPVLGWVQANLDRDVSVDDLAHRANMSVRTFNRRFVSATGTTPHRWLTAQRVGLAERLLEETNLDVERVAQQTGFGNAATLRHHFGRRRGTSPHLYRRSFRNGGPA